MNRTWIFLALMAAVGLLIAGVAFTQMSPAPSHEQSEPTPKPNEVVREEPSAPSPTIGTTTTSSTPPPVERTRPAPAPHPRITAIEPMMHAIMRTHITQEGLPDDASAEEAEDYLQEQLTDLTQDVRRVGRSLRTIDGTVEQRALALEHAAHLYEHLAQELQNAEIPRNMSPDRANEYQESMVQQAEATRSKAIAIREEIEAQ